MISLLFGLCASVNAEGGAGDCYVHNLGRFDGVAQCEAAAEDLIGQMPRVEIMRLLIHPSVEELVLKCVDSDAAGAVIT